MKKIIYKFFHPHKVLAIPLCIFSILLLIFVFSMHLEKSVISYVAYSLSTYALILFILWFCKACKFSSDFFKETKIYQFYEEHSHTFMKGTLILSSIINFIYGVFKLITGIYYQSFWFITFAVYYLILFFMKANLIKDAKKFGEHIKKEYQKLKNTGILLLLLNIVLVGMIVLIITKNQYFSYPGYLIYAMALYDFYLIITAILNVLKHRKNKSPIIFASKCISLTVAMISMLSLEVAMIYQFGDHDETFKIIMTGCTGFGIAFINSVMAIVMIYKGNKGKKSNKVDL